MFTPNNINAELVCDSFKSIKRWCRWFLSAVKGDCFLRILNVNTLVVSKTGIIRTANTKAGEA
ncbi:hypothetical protein D3C80_971680 [compost metagenome]